MLYSRTNLSTSIHYKCLKLTLENFLGRASVSYSVRTSWPRLKGIKVEKTGIFSQKSMKLQGVRAGELGGVIYATHARGLS